MRYCIYRNIVLDLEVINIKYVGKIGFHLQNLFLSFDIRIIKKLKTTHKFMETCINKMVCIYE